MAISPCPSYKIRENKKLKPFKQKTNPLKTSVFFKKGFFVLFFLIFLVVTLSPTHSAIAKQSFFSKMYSTIDMGADSWWKLPNKEQLNEALRQIDKEACSFLDTPVKCLLLPLFNFAGDLLKMSGTLFVWIINTDNIKLILTSPALYEIWTYVRDLLNMAFIMVLLFSAFCTIFQVEQYNYKKMLWKIVLMALLVNFSFPITRFIIDASNILMYSIIKSDFFTDSQAYSSLGIITKNSTLATLMTHQTWPNAGSLIGATVMLFMLAITFLAIGILLLIRIITLAVLIIFSPVAFAGSIIPGVSAQASKWWDNLFKYSFFGPIMIIGVAIAVKLMNGIGKDLSTKALEAARGQTTVEATNLGSMVFILVPIVLLWIVMGVAQSMSISGAGAVMGGAQKALKWAGKAPVRAGWWGIKKTGVPGGIQQKWAQFKKSGLLGSDARERREAWVAEKTPYKVKGAINEHARKKANEKLNEWEKTGPPPKKELKEMLSGSDNIKARAAALKLAESTGFDGNYENYKTAVEKIMKGDQAGIEMLNEKTKKKGRDMILAHKINTQPELKLQDELAKLSSSDFSGINFENLIANTTESGDRGGDKAVRSFFTSIKDNNDRKIQISRNISPKSEEYLEREQLFTAKKQNRQESKEEPKIEVVGGSYSSRSKDTFDAKGKI